MVAEKTLLGRPLDQESIRLLPHSFCTSNLAVVIGDVDPLGETPIEVATARANDPSFHDLIARKFPGREIKLLQAPHEKIKDAIAFGFGLSDYEGGENDDNPPLAGVADSFDRGGGRRESNSDEISLPSYDNKRSMPVGGQIEGETRPTIDLVNKLLMDAIRRGSTDIHVENFRKEVQVRYKIDGLLYRVNTPINRDNIKEVVSRVKVMAGMDISEHSTPQDGRILFRTIRKNQDYDVPFRISILPGMYGEDMVLRVLDKSMAPIDLELLGFKSNDLAKFRRLVKNPQGMVLVTGPTGSGKTTTLYAVLKEIKTPYNKILSAEDPIEYTLEGVNQKQVSKKFGFADMARAFLRHDPDILLIGEIRDEDTADVSVKAAQTGHLILSTLHTNDSISAITRLRSLGVNATMCASSLLGVLSQRLIRRNCKHCLTEYTPEPEAQKLFGDLIRGKKLVRGTGCKACNMTGYKGRIGVFELFIVDTKIQSQIQKERPLGEIMQTALASGMVPLVYDALTKVFAGVSTLEEIIRVIPHRQIVSQLKKEYEEI